MGKNKEEGRKQEQDLNTGNSSTPRPGKKEKKRRKT